MEGQNGSKKGKTWVFQVSLLWAFTFLTEEINETFRNRNCFPSLGNQTINTLK